MTVDSHLNSVVSFYKTNFIENYDESVNDEKLVQFIKKHLLSLSNSQERIELFQRTLRAIREQIVLKKLSMVYDPFFFENPSLNTNNRTLKILVHELRRLVY
ncbi:hypothetical protein [Owenweeksia hongkongensis]|uniref:hypothetical protein n=1 Tax=Owenweeksia hongkongensis TaxID=253245 RepID=UPI003A92DFFD